MCLFRSGPSHSVPTPLLCEESLCEFPLVFYFGNRLCGYPAMTQNRHIADWATGIQPQIQREGGIVTGRDLRIGTSELIVDQHSTAFGNRTLLLASPHRIPRTRLFLPGPSHSILNNAVADAIRIPDPHVNPDLRFFGSRFDEHLNRIPRQHGICTSPANTLRRLQDVNSWTAPPSLPRKLFDHILLFVSTNHPPTALSRPSGTAAI